MTDSTAFRQMDEKHVSVDVQLMLWSPKFDLVALSNVQGEVIKKILNSIVNTTIHVLCKKLFVYVDFHMNAKNCITLLSLLLLLSLVSVNLSLFMIT